MRRKKTPIIGSGNVFADLGLPNPDTELQKSRLVAEIAKIIDARGLTQAEAAAILGLTEAELTNLQKGRFGTYSVARLSRYLTLLAG